MGLLGDGTLKGFVAKAGLNCTGFRPSGSCRVCTLFALLRAGHPCGLPHSTTEASSMAWTLRFCPQGSSLYPESTQELATSGSQAPGAAPTRAAGGAAG